MAALTDQNKLEKKPLFQRNKLSYCYQNNYTKIFDDVPSSSIATNVIKNPKDKMDWNKINIRKIGVYLFIGASIFCLYEIWASENVKAKPKHIVKRLKLVNIFNRHGDRAPSDALPKGDRHAERISFFWPDGLHNLTDIGRLREFRVGLETRRGYNKYLDFDANNVLAFSSPVYRCQASMEQILKGIFEINWTKDMGRQLISKGADCVSCLPKGSGSPDDWKSIKIDTATVPSLTHDYLDNCAYRKKNPSPLDKDFSINPQIKSLRGIERLKDVIKKKYDQDFGISNLALYSSITSEMELMRTTNTINYTDHYRDWVNINVSTRGDSAITLFDVLEQACLLGSRYRIDDTANYIQSGHIVTSLIESQMMALNNNASNERMKMYQGKQMILYSTHDTTLQILLSTLGILRLDSSSSYEHRFYKWSKSDDEEGKFLAGLKMTSYGTSIRFELWELEMDQDGIKSKVNYVQASIYNRDDAKFKPVEYKHVELGTACRKLFAIKYPRLSVDSYYPENLQIDMKLNCPFDLFKNVTADLMIDDNRIKQLCNSA